MNKEKKEKKQYFEDGCEIRPMTEGEAEIARGLDEFFAKEDCKEKKEIEEEVKITEEKWFKELPVDERIIWLRIIRNQMLDNLQNTSKIIYNPRQK